MNRLQKKCIIASVGIHLLLPILLLVAGAGFFSPKSTDIPINNFIAASTVDEALSGGGDNTVKGPPALAITPPAVPETPVTPPTPVPPLVAQKPPPMPVERTVSPAPRITPKETTVAKPDVPVVDTKPRTHKIEVNTALVTSSATDAKASQDAARKAAAAKAAAEKRRAEAISHALAGIRGGVAGSTEVRLFGPGGGGVPYANFLSAVQTVYFNAWRQPDSAPGVLVRVSVSIARDGTVLSARIVSPSGNSAVDKSVQETIERVKYAAPLPESSSEESRSVIVNFKTQETATG